MYHVFDQRKHCLLTLLLACFTKQNLSAAIRYASLAQIGEQKEEWDQFPKEKRLPSCCCQDDSNKKLVVKHLPWYLWLAYSILGKLILNMEALQKELAKIQVTAPDVNLLP